MSFSLTAHLIWALVAATLQLSPVTASPKVWYTPTLRAKYLANYSSTVSCVAHPSQSYVGTPHQSPLENDSSISFTFAHSNDVLAPVLCPGVEHTIKVSYAETKRLGLLTADPPAVSFTSPTPTEGCPNRVDLGNSTKTIAQPGYTATFKVPCSMAGSPVEFKITTVIVGGDKQWRQNTVVMPVADMRSLPPACAAAVAQACPCTRSTLGYVCMTTMGNVTVHWTVNSTAAPADNGCTPSSRTVLQASEVQEDGTLHMAVQAASTGYVALGFAPTAGVMIPADMILGWVGDNSAFLNTFDARVPAVDATTNNTADSWAYDRGVALDPSTGVTTICFSRRLRDDRAKSSPDIRGNTTLGLNWAVSPRDELVTHEGAGGALVNLMSGEQLPAPPPAALSGGPACTPSPMGYDCMTQKDKITLHWSINATRAPENTCTPASRVAQSAEDLKQYGTLHMAVQARVNGYVALGFSEDGHSMYPADIILGWAGVTGPYIKTFYTTAEKLSDANLNPPANSGKVSWAYDTGVVQEGTGVTTICFSRRLVDSSAIASPDLRASTGESISSSSSEVLPPQQQGGRRLLDDDDGHQGGRLGLIWAVSEWEALAEHTDGNYGGFFLDLSGGATEEEEGGEYWIDVHGALMAVAWGLLLPLGTLLPAHRWLLGDAKVKVPGLGEKHWWFLIHVVCQWSGMVLFIAGFIVAFEKLEAGDDLAKSHRDIGIAIMAAAGTQVLVAYVRPAPDSPRRGIWNLVHHNLGRATVLLAWANVYIGIVVYHQDDGAEYKEWITPIAIVMGLLAIIDLALRIFRPAKETSQGAVAARDPNTELTKQTADPYGGPRSGAAGGGAANGERAAIMTA